MKIAARIAPVQAAFIPTPRNRPQIERQLRQSGKSERAVLKPAIPVDQMRTGQPRFRARIQASRQVLQRIRAHQRIRVEEQKVTNSFRLRQRRLHPLVICHPKTNVFLILQQVRLGI